MYMRGEKGLNLPYLSNCQGATAPSPSAAVSHATLLRLLYTPVPEVGVACVAGRGERGLITRPAGSGDRYLNASDTAATATDALVSRIYIYYIVYTYIHTYVRTICIRAHAFVSRFPNPFIGTCRYNQ